MCKAMVQLKKGFPAGIYLLKVNNRNIRTRCSICSKITIKNNVVNFEHISHLLLVFVLLTLNIQLPTGLSQHAGLDSWKHC